MTLHLNVTSSTCGAVHYAARNSFNLRGCEKNSYSATIIEQYFPLLSLVEIPENVKISSFGKTKTSR